ncbi:MAG: glycosyltransferase [Aphanocapsa sp. GSE-SYN-MK-11-07L]|jgi:glycosyltransferase involved in cell wall biosynthesis|nr:glycosyltransferase [Aphanocapsa sp. GSE-SYN-MK-11-07L]
MTSSANDRKNPNMQLSVVIPIYNRARMLAQALESLRRQTYKDFAVIICDDASTDSFKEVLEQFTDLKIEYHRYDANVGQFKNAMRGLEHCQTPFVKYLHSDDLLFPQAIKMQLKALQDVSKAAICLGGSIEFEELHDQHKVKLHSYQKPYVPALKTSQQWAKLEYYSGYLPSASIFRTELLRDIGGFNTGLVGIADWEIFVALSSNHPVVAVDQPVCAYRFHPDQLTKNYFFDSEEAVLTKDLLWMTSNANPYRERLGLPSDQLFFLRQDILWQNLQIALKSNRKLLLSNKWLKLAISSQMLLPFILGFPLFAIRKLLRKPKVQSIENEAINRETYLEMISEILFYSVSISQ